MKPVFISVILLLVLILCSSWGFFAHRRINHLAVFILPDGMIRFYKNNILFLTEHATDPDKKRFTDTTEAPKHYLDAEAYETDIDSIPYRWEDAISKYGLRCLNGNGILPWQIRRSYFQLVNAFERRDAMMILKRSAELGHYIADAHVPLHTTANHDGQLSHQRGIHAFWESRLPELFSSRYNFLTGKAVYIENPLKEAWRIIRHTHSLADSVLKAESELNSDFPQREKYSYERKDRQLMKQYALAYAAVYHQRLNGMVERQMRASVFATGCFWFSAWVDAGQPTLENLASSR